MRPLSHSEQLALLNANRPDRPWKSPSEKRQCIICETVFRGAEVILDAEKSRGEKMCCPQCGSGPSLWVRLGNPLLEKEIWADWESAMEFNQQEEDETEKLQAAG